MHTLNRQAIAKAHPDEIQVLNGHAFFYPTHTQNDLVFGTDQYDWDAHEGYTWVTAGELMLNDSYHAWASTTWKWVHDLTPTDVIEKDTSFHRLLRRYA
jgi:hypothetical protein